MKCIGDATVNSYSFMSCAEFDPWSRICSGGQNGFVSRYTSLFGKYVAQKRDESYYLLRVANRHGSRAQSSIHSDSATATYSESGESSVAGAVVAAKGDSGTSSGRPSKGQKYGSLGSLLGRKRSSKETVNVKSKKKKKGSTTSVKKNEASSSKD